MRFQWKDMLYMRFHRNNGIDWFLAMPVVTVVISASQHRAETRTDVKVSRLNLLFLLCIRNPFEQKKKSPCLHYKIDNFYKDNKQKPELSEGYIYICT
ncbi:hypothetical protein HanXRQr2_Chr10g0458211 [Helianthus annuus]|uniref:Uncharacterized protein n=1 Tax=Helianthus annuus TaxID=4232 RepID=A0A9K3I0X2_HELAN|nr:hypothetical protein HanXRQr2_Chr10g0458211 [Helianthus annuus]